MANIQGLSAANMTPCAPSMDAARAALSTYFGYEAFRQGQEVLIGAVLSGRDALGWVGSRILHVQQCYRFSEAPSGAMRLTPVWLIETDTGSFCVGGMSREITGWDS